MSGPLLQARSLAVLYGKVEAVSGISLDVEAGSITTLIGPNGAGKTSTLGALMGLLPARGEIEFDGEPIAHLSVEQRVALGISLVPEKRELFAQMSVRDNLDLGAFLRHRRGDKTVRRSLESVCSLFPRLEERLDQAAGTLSGGERQMLAIGRALMAEPRLLMLDEPSLGLAPLITAEIFRTIEALRTDGVSVLLVEQNARAALKISDFGYVLESGDLTVSGSAQALESDPRVVESYLGAGHQRRRT
jgi:branched-chain amino acid transport system ATP-binding protein